MVLSDIFSSRAMVGTTGQQRPSLFGPSPQVEAHGDGPVGSFLFPDFSKTA